MVLFDGSDRVVAAIWLNDQTAETGQELAGGAPVGAEVAPAGQRQRRQGEDGRYGAAVIEMLLGLVLLLSCDSAIVLSPSALRMM